MSLLESIVSLVIVAIAAVGFLGSVQQSARAARDADLWLRGAQIAEAAIEAHKAGAEAPPNEPAFVTRMTQQPLGSGLVDLEVVVRLPDGQEMVVHRIVAP